MILLLILMLELRDKLEVRDEIEVARAVQLALLPDRNPDLPGWGIWLMSRPANSVGGDLADYLPGRENRLGLALGDVAGKGLGAALLMAKLQATLRAIASDFPSLAELGSRINEIFCRDCDPTGFATLIYVEIEEDSGHLRLLNAGHPPPIVIRGAAVEELPPVAVPIGMLSDAVYQEQHLELEPGDLLVLYSDGLTEASNAQGAFFDEERMKTLLPSLRGLSAEHAGERIVREVLTFIGDARSRDDLSLILLKKL